VTSEGFPSTPPSSPRRNATGAFSEASAWSSVGAGWRPLHGNFRNLGYSIEWHDFTAQQDLDWSRSFHPGSVEICLNLAGSAEVRTDGSTIEFASQTAGFYFQNKLTLRGVRRGGERHQFITIELSREFVQQHIGSDDAATHPRLATFLARRNAGASVSEATPLTSDHRAMVMSLRKPPVFAAAQRLWYHAKALEVASAFFYKVPSAQELFCEQQKRLNQERAKRVISVLKENLAEPPTLEEIARRVGCSPFYLSRIFSQEIGQTMTQYLRQLRMELAAQMLLEGKLKITSIALEVGYSSASHFSTAFHETFGCCPGLYPLRTSTQRLDKPSD
jgi:AraC-like DNA-binding protein